MKNGIVCVLSLGLVGCVAGAGSDADAPSEQSVADDSVIIGGDVSMSRAEFDAWQAASDPQVDKAYWTIDPTVSRWRTESNYRLVFSPEVPNVWRVAFRDAGVEWSRGTNCVSISEDGNGRPLRIEVDPRLPGSVTGLTRRRYDPQEMWGEWIKIITTERCRVECVNNEAGDQCREVCEPSKWSMSTTPYHAALEVALHELGHALGFVHPFDVDPYNGATLPGGKPIPGTQSDGAGTQRADTVMYPQADALHPLLSELTPDDNKGRDLMFGTTMCKFGQGCNDLCYTDEGGNMQCYNPCATPDFHP